MHRPGNLIEAAVEIITPPRANPLRRQRYRGVERRRNQRPHGPALGPPALSQRRWRTGTHWDGSRRPEIRHESARTGVGIGVNWCQPDIRTDVRTETCETPPLSNRRGLSSQSAPAGRAIAGCRSRRGAGPPSTARPVWAGSRSGVPVGARAAVRGVRQRPVPRSCRPDGASAPNGAGWSQPDRQRPAWTPPAALIRPRSAAGHDDTRGEFDEMAAAAAAFMWCPCRALCTSPGRADSPGRWRSGRALAADRPSRSSAGAACLARLLHTLTIRQDNHRRIARPTAVEAASGTAGASAWAGAGPPGA